MKHPGQRDEKSVNSFQLVAKNLREIQVHGENCIECVKTVEKLKLLSKQGDLGKLPQVVEPNQKF